MGHIRLGTLPGSRKWREVVELLRSEADFTEVAAAVVKASEADLALSSQDQPSNLSSGSSLSFLFVRAARTLKRRYSASVFRLRPPVRFLICWPVYPPRGLPDTYQPEQLNNMTAEPLSKQPAPDGEETTKPDDALKPEDSKS